MNKVSSGHSTMTRAQHLLPELIDCVVDHQRGDASALASMCLVSRACHARASLHFFETIHIVEGSRLSAFEVVLRDSTPFFRRYVRSLILGTPNTRQAHTPSPTLHLEPHRLFQLISALPNLDLRRVAIGSIIWTFPCHLRSMIYPSQPEGLSGYLYSLVDHTYPTDAYADSPVNPATSMVLPTVTCDPALLDVTTPVGQSYTAIKCVALHRLQPAASSFEFDSPNLFHRCREIVARIASLEAIDTLCAAFHDIGPLVHAFSIHWCNARTLRCAPSKLVRMAVTRTS